MKAIIFAAGLGTRLKPLTDNYPKAMVTLNGKPLLWYAITYLESFGIKEIVVNIHHFGDQIIRYLNETRFKAKILISDERDELLDTGGGLLKAKQLLLGNEPIVAFNVDVVSSVDILKVLKYHTQKEALATLVVRKRETSRYFLFDANMKMTGWKNVTSGEEIVSINCFADLQPWAFSGIQILSPEIFDLITETGKFSITPMYLRLAKAHKIMGYPDPSDFWLDLGNPGQIQIAEKYLKGKKSLINGH